MNYDINDYTENFTRIGGYPGQLFYLPVGPQPKGSPRVLQRIGQLVAICSHGSTLDNEGTLESDYAVIVLPLLEQHQDKGWIMSFESSAEGWPAADVMPIPDEEKKKLLPSLYAYGPLQDVDGYDAFVRMYSAPIPG